MSRFRFVEAEAAQFPVSLLCRVVGVTRQGFYARRRRPPSARELADRKLGERICEIHAETEEIYGAPRIHSELRLGDGIRVGKKRVARLMRQLGLRGADGKRGGPRTTIRDPKRPSAPDLVEALFESGSIDEAGAVLAEVRGAPEPITRALVTVTDSSFDLAVAGDAGPEQREAWREEARIVFERAGHEYGLARYWWSVAGESWYACRAESAADACERALEYLERTGNPRSGLAIPIRARAMRSLVYGPTPVVEAIERVQAMRRVDLGILFDSSASATLGVLYAMNGEIERARELVRVGRQAHLDAGLIVSAGGLAMAEFMVERRAGDLKAAETSLREGLDVLGQVGDRSYYPTVAVDLAWVLYEQGRYDEAHVWCDRARETTAADDLVNFIFFETIEGCLLARRGEFDEAEKRARSALERSQAIDFTEAQAAVRVLLAEALALGGRMEEAAVLAREGLSIREAKGDIAAAARERRRLSELGIDVG